MRCLFYPRWWLKVAGYWSKFDAPVDYEPFGTSQYPAIEPPPVEPMETSSLSETNSSPDANWLMLSYLLVSVTTGWLGYLLGFTRSKLNASQSNESSSKNKNNEKQALNTSSPKSFYGMKYGEGSTMKVKPQISYTPVGSHRNLHQEV